MAQGKFGDYNCDSSEELVKSATQFIKQYSEGLSNVPFILWTGWESLSSLYLLFELFMTYWFEIPSSEILTDQILEFFLSIWFCIPIWIGSKIEKMELNSEFENNSLYFLFNSCYVKFIYSEKPTRFCEISTVNLSYVVPVKSTVEISQNFVAFSEYMNFTRSAVVAVIVSCVTTNYRETIGRL